MSFLIIIPAGTVILMGVALWYLKTAPALREAGGWTCPKCGKRPMSASYIQADYIVLECDDCGFECDECGEPYVVPAYYGRSIHQPIFRKGI